MRNNPFAGFLVVVTVVMMVFTAENTRRYFVWTNKLQTLLVQYAGMESMRLTVQNLANESLDYSRTHPAIDPTLQQFGIKAKPTNALAAPSTLRPSK